MLQIHEGHNTSRVHANAFNERTKGARGGSFYGHNSRPPTQRSVHSRPLGRRLSVNKLEAVEGHLQLTILYCKHSASKVKGTLLAERPRHQVKPRPVQRGRVLKAANAARRVQQLHVERERGVVLQEAWVSREGVAAQPRNLGRASGPTHNLSVA